MLKIVSQGIFVLFYVTLCYTSNQHEGFQSVYYNHFRVGRVSQTVCNDDTDVLSSAL
jgi:hypothetical protein